MRDVLDRELIKVKMPDLFIRKTILNSVFQAPPFPIVYRAMYNKANIYTGYSECGEDRLPQHQFVGKKRYEITGKGYKTTHIECYETQTSYEAYILETNIHNYFPPIVKNEEDNIMHPIDLEKEYYESDGKELELYELLGHSAVDNRNHF